MTRRPLGWAALATVLAVMGACSSGSSSPSSSSPSSSVPASIPPVSAPATTSASASPSTAAAAAAPSTQGPPGPLYVVPTTTADAAAPSPATPYYAEPPGGASNGLLFVFLPGTGAGPPCCRDVLDEASAIGFHAIGLTYSNSVTVATRCASDLTCYGTVRRNTLDGSDSSSDSDVTPGDSVQQRLVALLDYLARAYPSGAWGDFVAGGSPRWSSIVIGGHSQGGGLAAFTATVDPVAGVVMFSSPEDATAGAVPHPAAWLSQTSLTPVARYAGFDSVSDPYHLRVVTDWATLGLGQFGAAVSVDGAAPPYGGSHELTTEVPPRAVGAGRSGTHDESAVDVATPLCPDGTPQFRAVWRYMLEVAGGLQITSGATGC
jgi:hypothetical protein